MINLVNPSAHPPFIQLLEKWRRSQGCLRGGLPYGLLEPSSMEAGLQQRSGSSSYRRHCPGAKVGHANSYKSAIPWSRVAISAAPSIINMWSAEVCHQTDRSPRQRSFLSRVITEIIKSASCLFTATRQSPSPIIEGRVRSTCMGICRETSPCLINPR